jgi:hypothetical protein
MLTTWSSNNNTHVNKHTLFKLTKGRTRLGRGDNGSLNSSLQDLQENKMLQAVTSIFAPAFGNASPPNTPNEKKCATPSNILFKAIGSARKLIDPFHLMESKPSLDDSYYSCDGNNDTSITIDPCETSITIDAPEDVLFTTEASPAMRTHTRWEEDGTYSRDTEELPEAEETDDSMECPDLVMDDEFEEDDVLFTTTPRAKRVSVTHGYLNLEAAKANSHVRFTDNNTRIVETVIDMPIEQEEVSVETVEAPVEVTVDIVEAEAADEEAEEEQEEINYSKMTVAVLRAELTELGLPTSGLKKALVQRMQNAAAGITVAEEAPTFADMKVAELKAELKQRGLSTSGLKKDLVKRLEQA